MGDKRVDPGVGSGGVFNYHQISHVLDEAGGKDLKQAIDA